LASGPRPRSDRLLPPSAGLKFGPDRGVNPHDQRAHALSRPDVDDCEPDRREHAPPAWDPSSRQASCGLYVRAPPRRFLDHKRSRRAQRAVRRVMRTPHDRTRAPRVRTPRAGTLLAFAVGIAVSSPPDGGKRKSRFTDNQGLRGARVAVLRYAVRGSGRARGDTRGLM
jgi:hypothetical protein